MKQFNPHFHLLFLFCLLRLSITAASGDASGDSVSVSAGRLSDEEATYIRRRQLLYYRDGFGDRGENVTVDPSLVFENPRIRDAYIALQAWKLAILSDPLNLTGNWSGPSVCDYTGELGLLTDLALFHINSNRFCGTVPHRFRDLRLLFELDLSNNRFVGRFPAVVLDLPSLKFLDIRFNEFEGRIPRRLFDKDLDAIFINHNRFVSDLPDNLGNSPVSVIVLANNHFKGCVPTSLGNMSKTLNEIILMNNGFRSCLPPEIGLLVNLTVFDISFNELVGPIPETVGSMVSLEQLNVAHNRLSGAIPDSVCRLPSLQNFTYSYNFFTAEPPRCLAVPSHDDRRNCLPGRPSQRSAAQCRSFLSKGPVDCGSFRCAPFVPALPPPPPPSPPPPWHPHHLHRHRSIALGLLLRPHR
ncbi:Leucine-rich repeat extensin-like protein 4 [Acorus calamus]|uniref:Leucine-rich repeat extensin-like protein 4 n=1 Tax=Acorus calamus TaxID=4465 RepID=A0AAV9C0B9_ACOCL|nr:Leucine-rich repeat extensin-like protein 4 [Acorus calamus]